MTDRRTRVAAACSTVATTVTSLLMAVGLVPESVPAPGPEAA